MPVADPPVTNQLMSAIKRAERIFSQPLTRAALIWFPSCLPYLASVGHRLVMPPDPLDGFVRMRR